MIIAIASWRWWLAHGVLVTYSRGNAIIGPTIITIVGGRMMSAASNSHRRLKANNAKLTIKTMPVRKACPSGLTG